MSDATPRVEVADRAAWRAWLMTHHRQSGSIWLVYPRKIPGRAGMSNDDIVEEALCFGWIDSLPRKLDESRSMLRLSPRQARSAWSALNKARVARMEAAGLMQPAGIAVVEAAKASGRWDALNTVEQLLLPDDLVSALDERPPAAERFAAFPRSVKRGILEWIGAAKRPDTRRARIVETAERAMRNERANQWRGR